jgi:acetoin utilization protein AcuB
MLTVSDLMTLGPASVAPDSSLRSVMDLMKAEGCRQLPVIEEGKLVGIITDRDVRLAVNSPLVLHGRWQDEEILDSVTAATCMTPDPLVVAPDTPAYTAASMLSTYKFGALPVVADGVLLGIVSVTDFLEYFVSQERHHVVGES